MAWVAPVITWIAGTGIAYTDFNRIEGNTDYLKTTQDTVVTNQGYLIEHLENATEDMQEGVTFALSNTDMLKNLLIAMTGVPTAGRVRGLHTGIRKQGAAYDYSHAEISAGIAPIDSVKIHWVRLASTFSKDISANWVAGDTNGGFPSGLVFAVDTEYKLFLILDSDTNTIDAGFDTSNTAANLLTDASAYDAYKQVGIVRTKASGVEIRFTQDDEGAFAERDNIKSCFPVTTVGYSSNTELTCESLYNKRGSFLNLNMPEHSSGLTASGTSLEYTFITDNTPDWVGIADADSSCAATFLNGSASGIENPGSLNLDSATPKLIAYTSTDAAPPIGPAYFTTGGAKGLNKNMAFTFHIWDGA